jgi:hypothetical protein
MRLEDKREFVKAFVSSEVGRDLFESAEGIVESNIKKAQDQNSLDYLSRSKGNREIIELFTNILRTEGKE